MNRIFMSFVKRLERDFNFLKLPIMNRIEITNKINHYIYLTKKNCYDFHNQSINYVKILPGKIKIWARKIEQLIKKEVNPYNYALPREKTSLINPQKYSDTIYINPDNYEVAEFCKNWIDEKKLGIVCSSCDNIYPGSFKHFNLSLNNTIDGRKLINDLEIAVFNRFGK